MKNKVIARYCHGICAESALQSITHYFGGLFDKLGNVKDVRQKGKIKYSASLLIMLAIWQRLAGVRSNNDFDYKLNEAEFIINNISSFLRVEVNKMPISDTIAGLMQSMPPNELREVKHYLIRSLQKK